LISRDIALVVGLILVLEIQAEYDDRPSASGTNY
jgi:hypothetical protein